MYENYCVTSFFTCFCVSEYVQYSGIVHTRFNSKW